MTREQIQARIALLEGDHVMIDNPFTRAELLSVYRLALEGPLGIDAQQWPCPVCGTSGIGNCTQPYRCSQGREMNLEAFFAKLRFDPAHHLGLGDIRLTLGQQEELVRLLGDGEKHS